MITAERFEAARQALANSDVDALLITPGADLRYLTGYDATPLERLTCLVLSTEGDPYVLVPQLEELAALASPAGQEGLPIRTYAEDVDPYALIAAHLPERGVIGLDDRMWAAKALAFQAALPAGRFLAAGRILHPLRIRKSADEVEALREAAAAIDAVHSQVPEFLGIGRSENEIARDIAEAIIATGHVRVDFIIVGSGPNGASPHHDVSDRRLQAGDAIVVDIGGTMPSGYRSDCTRMYSLGNPSTEFMAAFEALRSAQHDGVSAVRPGRTCEELDAVPREALSAMGFGEAFIHRTGHGIGLETHEDPYLVVGNDLVVEPGMTFSVEPGVYIPGSFGARIEDIVVVTHDGGESLNHCPRDLVIVS